MSTAANRPPQSPAEVLPGFLKTEASPAIPDAVGGIALVAEPPRLSATGPTWPLRGCFRVARAGAADASVLRRLVIALTSDASHVTQARHAVADAALFGGDVKVGANDVTGYFNVDLADLFALAHKQETFHIVASIGADASDVLTCKVEFPWIDWPQVGPTQAAKDEAEMEDQEDAEDEGDDDSWMVDEDQEIHR